MPEASISLKNYISTKTINIIEMKFILEHQKFEKYLHMSRCNFYNVHC